MNNKHKSHEQLKRIIKQLINCMLRYVYMFTNKSRQYNLQQSAVSMKQYGSNFLLNEMLNSENQWPNQDFSTSIFIRQVHWRVSRMRTERQIQQPTMCFVTNSLFRCLDFPTLETSRHCSLLECYKLSADRTASLVDRADTFRLQENAVILVR